MIYAVQPGSLGDMLDINGCTWASNLEEAKAIAEAKVLRDGPQVVWAVRGYGKPYKLMGLKL